MPVSSDGTGTYDEVIAAGRLQIVKRTEGVSTTDFINRLMSFADGNKDAGSLREQNVQMLISTHRISQFSKPNRVPKDSDKIVYIDGCFDLFHVGHATTLQQAKALGDFLVVGIHDDATVNKIKGGNYPIASLYERVLCLCACKWVDEVILAAPIVVTQDLIKTLNIDLVAVGSHTQSNHYREKGFTVDVCNADPYKIPREMGILRGVQSKYPTLTPGVIAGREGIRQLMGLSVRGCDLVSILFWIVGFGFVIQGHKKKSTTWVTEMHKHHPTAICHDMRPQSPLSLSHTHTHTHTHRCQHGSRQTARRTSDATQTVISAKKSTIIKKLKEEKPKWSLD